MGIKFLNYYACIAPNFKENQVLNGTFRKLMGAGKGQNPLFNVLLYFVGFLARFVIFRNFGVDRPTERPRYKSQSLKTYLVCRMQELV